MKFKVAETKDYLIRYEDFQGLTFIHCDLKSPWSKTVKEKLKQDFEQLKRLHGGHIFALHEPEDTKHQKFLSMFGFEYVQDILTLDGQLKQVFVTGKHYG